MEQAMAYDFSGRTALVTGACKGIGRFTTIAMLEAGASVIAADLTPCPRSLELFRTRSEKVHFIRTDVTDAAQVRAMVRQTGKRFGSLDFAVNNAGVYRYQTLTHSQSRHMPARQCTPTIHRQPESSTEELPHSTSGRQIHHR